MLSSGLWRFGEADLDHTGSLYGKHDQNIVRVIQSLITN